MAIEAKNFSKNPKPQEISRRQMLGLMAVAGVSVMGGVKSLGDFLMSDPPVSPSSSDSGWIESEDNAPFIQINQGPFGFALEASQIIPAIRETTDDYFRFLSDQINSGSPLSLGDMTKTPISLARQKLATYFNSDIHNLGLEAVHVGSLVNFLATCGWMNKSQMKSLEIIPGVLDSDVDLGSFYWGRNGLETVMPEVFAGNNPDDEPLTRHFFAHTFITFEHIYARNNNLESVLDGQPRFLTILQGLKGLVHREWDIEDEARDYSATLGRLYKISEMGLANKRSWPFWPINRTGKGIKGGIWDPQNPARYATNRLGADTAIKLYNLSAFGQNLDPVFSRLDNPIFLSAKNDKVTLEL